ncbi:ABC transporter ATP-binding protein [Methanobrevibacter oralis]|uniref:Iron import ATP-binding/permease protein IrtA n=1 Tax=Methanobrevibacter oralis TaxID=66851 RepID=A0A166BIT1_METOA|nr:ABC transporter ATP-binding protein [Methanobrevibacter oralis]KZX13413.1 iron import ATP-binding/permease protein IrtA [Methanobrevibacter oralis]
MNNFSKTFSYAKEYKNKIYLAIILIFFSVVSELITFILTYDIIINFIDNSITFEHIIIIGFAIIFFLFLKSIFYIKGLDFSHEAAYDTLMGMRIQFAEKMTKLPLGVINQKGTGSYKKNFVDDIEQVELILAHMIPEGLPYVIICILVFAMLFVLDWRLGLLTIASTSIGLVAIFWMIKSGVDKMVYYYESSKNMNSNIVEYIAGMEVIKIFNRTTSSYEKYSSSVEDYKKYTLDWYNESWNYMAIYASVLPCTILFTLPVGTLFYFQGTLALSTLIFALLISISLGSPLLKMVVFFPLIPRLSYQITELEETFAGEELQITDKSLKPENYGIEFENVRFAYDKTEVIKDVSFKVAENSVTALVGESGSGKSTLAKLLVHFWDLKDGKISIGGVNINGISFGDLMDLISYVSQDNFLFNESIMENIRIGKPTASDDEVIAASKLAQCHDFIVKLDQGYDTNVGDDGNKLSGGEKQRITIARAILKDAPIIILDEATTFTDSENEDKIQEAINSLVGKKTLIVIAHRLSSIVESDNIILMDDGKLLMQGTHEDLLENSNKYKLLWEAHVESLNWDINIKEEK